MRSVLYHYEVLLQMLIYLNLMINYIDKYFLSLTDEATGLERLSNLLKAGSLTLKPMLPASKNNVLPCTEFNSWDRL